MNPLPRPINFAQELISSVLSEGDFAIDATVGNGHDALFLCRCVGTEGKILGFDVQQAAIEATAKRLRDNGIDPTCYELKLGSHAELERGDLTLVGAAMFNLGYLPGSDKSVITCPEASIPALKGVMKALKSGGIITVMCYPGHQGGDTEARAVSEFCRQLDRKAWQVLRIDELESLPKRPFLIALSKR